MLDQVVRELGDGEDIDQVEEELDRSGLGRTRATVAQQSLG